MAARFFSAFTRAKPSSLVRYYTPHSLTAAGALFGVAAVSLQALFVLQAYQTNPLGKLVVPPGATHGEEVHSHSFQGSHDSNAPNTNKLVHVVKQRLHGAYQSTKLDLERKRHELRIRMQATKKVNMDSSDIKTTKNRPHKIIVIGDSLACGVGCVNRWDRNDPDSSDTSDEVVDRGPVLPRIFANTLSQRLQCNVQWRSAGVVGGCVEDIRRECMDVIRQEVQSGNPPDVIVVLCGMNDMKRILTSPLNAVSALTFRNSLCEFCEEIRNEAPTAQVVLPALPINMLYYCDDNSTQKKNNLCNIFPLSFFLDCFIRFWDLQKHYVAKQLHGHVTFIGRPDALIQENTRRRENQVNAIHDNILASSPSLTSEDGVHPSDHGYFLWARFLGQSLVLQHIKDISIERMEKVKEKSREQIQNVKQRSKEWIARKQ
eukprot:CAMPEP_0172422320 /NCGR_PEP_ID=MMETSP1064-20121228/8486_1 /TAXON_ID=202472 /ORGANISM="Aulacoseira subarctica , Strain CCAP 1002/5" /LENGTH=430 /DNA_ID=CAMNT_0013163127 /DNA_START=37 /DNA_END=1329 /DNA_ORIENTATION=+